MIKRVREDLFELGEHAISSIASEDNRLPPISRLFPHLLPMHSRPQRGDEMGQNAPQSEPQKPRSSQQPDAYVASSPDAILVWDRAGKILLLNAAALALFEVQAADAWLGASAQQFLQRYTWCDEQQRPFSFAPWLLDLTTFKEEAASFPYEQTLVLALPSRHQMLLDLRCALVLDGEPQPTGVLAVFHALAPRYQRALHIQRVHEALEALNEAIERIPEQRSVASSDASPLFSPPVILVAQQFVDVIRQVLACWGVKLLAFRAPNLYLSYIVGSGFTTEQNQWFREIGQHLRFTDFFDKTTLARLQANQAAILLPEHIRTPVGYPEEFGDATLLALPLFQEQILAGMLVITKRGEYTPGEIDLVRIVAKQALLLMECISYLQKPMGERARELVLPEVDRLSSDFLRLAGHELRTPLTGMKGNLQLAQRRLERLQCELAQQTECIGAHIERTRQSLEAAEQSVRLQERMVQDMIDDARIQAGQLDLALAPCNLLVLVKQAVAQQQESVPERAITLEILTPESTIPVLADAGRIIQVLTIYLITALASSPAEQPVTVQVQEEEQMARVSVHDEGPGIPLEEQTRLWDRFYRGKGSSVQQELDLSLGLRFYLCQALLERHHGTVGVESTPGQGTTFWLSLPVAKPAGG